MQYGWQKWKATTAALLSLIFWLQGHIPNQKSLWELFTQDGTNQPHWLMDYVAGNQPCRLFQALHLDLLQLISTVEAQ